MNRASVVANQTSAFVVFAAIVIVVTVTLLVVTTPASRLVLCTNGQAVCPYVTYSCDAAVTPVWHCPLHDNCLPSTNEETCGMYGTCTSSPTLQMYVCVCDPGYVTFPDGQTCHMTDHSSSSAAVVSSTGMTPVLSSTAAPGPASSGLPPGSGSSGGATASTGG